MLLCFGCDEDRTPEWDILIKNGLILDGSGKPAFEANIGILNDTIAFIGSLKDKRYKAKQVIDAQGFIIAPGFIDPHTHSISDLSDSVKNANLNYLFQGVTTVVLGNDGNSVNLIGQQLEHYDKNGIGTNAAMMVGHRNIRRTVMGMADRPPDLEEMENMKTLVRRGMEEGALGFSTGLFYAPASFATTEEVIELAKVAREYGGIYDAHSRDESSYSIGLLAAVEEAIRVGREAEIHVNISHIKCLGVDVWGYSGEVIALIEDARHDGVSITADQYPYRASGTHLDRALLPNRFFADDFEYRQKLENEALLPEIIAGMKENLRRRGGPASILIISAKDEELNGLNLEEISNAWDMSAVDAALKIMKNGSAAIASFNMQDADIQNFMARSWVMTGSDGTNAHPRKYGTFPKKIREYVLEKGVLELPEMIRKSTSLPAEIFGIPNRGKLKEGFFADLIVFKPEDVKDNSTYENPAELAEGMEYVIVNGKFAIKNGEFTGYLAGQTIRKMESKELLD